MLMMMKLRPATGGIVAAIITLVALAAAPAGAQNTHTADDTSSNRPSPPRFGGPDMVEVQIADDDRAKKPVIKRRFFQSYFDWKNQLKEKRGLSLSIDYSAAFLGASESLDQDRASGGMVRFFGAWDLTGRNTGNTGAFIWKVEHRHAYTDVAPSGFGFNLGYVGLFVPPFSDQGRRWTNLYWRQRFNGGKISVIGGFLDATDYVDAYALASPWTGFVNFAFSTGSTTLPVPNDAAFGFAAAAMITDNLYLIGGLADSNADPTDPFDGFDSFFNDREYFKHIEVGWVTSQDRFILDNIHLTLWHTDERFEAVTPSGWGANFSWTHYIGGKWLPFVRAGYADDGGSLMQKSVSVGFGYQRDPGKDLLGVGLNWGEPNESTFVPGLDDQYTVEVFYRIQFTERFALTPDLEFLKNPALNPDEDSIWIFGLRARLAL